MWMATILAVTGAAETILTALSPLAVTGNQPHTITVDNDGSNIRRPTPTAAVRPIPCIYDRDSLVPSFF